jgi:hypothetical protein
MPIGIGIGIGIIIGMPFIIGIMPFMPIGIMPFIIGIMFIMGFMPIMFIPFIGIAFIGIPMLVFVFGIAFIMLVGASYGAMRSAQVCARCAFAPAGGFLC